LAGGSVSTTVYTNQRGVLNNLYRSSKHVITYVITTANLGYNLNKNANLVSSLLQMPNLGYKLG